MKHLKVTSVVLTIAICMSMFMPTVSVLADEAAAPSETQSTEETEKQTPKETVKPKETEKPAPKETEKKETEPSEKKETEATEKPAAQETEKQEPEKQEPAETEKQIPAETSKTEPAETEKQEPAETETQNPTETSKTEPSETEKRESEQTESQVPEETEEQEPEITEAPVQETEDKKDPKNATYEGSCGDSMSWTLTNGVLEITGSGSMETKGWIQYKDSIKTINIGSGVTKICYGAFSGCKNLTSVSLPSTLKEIGNEAFSDCTKLSSIVIPENVYEIYSYAFSGCSSLSSVTFKGDLWKIGAAVFKNCTSLTSITIPSQVTLIDYNAFQGCTSLTKITLPNKVDTICDGAFSGCTNLTEINIPYGVTNLSDDAFNGCISLKSIEIPGSVNRIGKNAFDGCSGLKSITIPVSVDNVWDYAFAGCSVLADVTYTGTEAQWGEIEISVGNVSLLKATLHATDTTSFDGAEGKIEGTSLSWTLTKAGTLTISGTGAMSDFNSNHYGGTSGITYDFYQAPWSAYKNKIKKVVISSGVTTIGNGAFNGCANLTTIEIANSVYLFGKDAFVDTSIESLTIPTSMTEIGEKAFADFLSLKTVTIPSTIKTIGDYAFLNCSNLTTVTLNTGITRICSGAFQNCAKLKTISLPDGIKRIENSAFNGSGLTEVTIPGTLAASGFGDFAFANCLSLTNVVISSGVPKIGSDAFAGCTNLKTVTIPLSVYEIGNAAFTGCTSLTDVYYAGTEKNWNQISFNGTGHDQLESARKHYNSSGVTLYDIQVLSCPYGTISFSNNPAPAGELITATVTPYDGFEFTNLEVNGTMYGSTFTMPDGIAKVKVYFTSKTYKLTVEHSSGGTASFSMNNVSAGGQVTLSVQPEEGFEIGSIKVNGEEIGTTPVFNMPARDTVVYVTFVQGGHTIELVYNKDYGAPTLNKYRANNGDKITITPNPKTGYKVDKIIVNEKPLNTDVYEFTMGSADTTVEVTYKRKSYYVIVSVPEGGTAEANTSTAGYGDKITITPSQYDGYKFDKITVNGVEKTGTTFDMPDGDARVVVYFTKIPYTIKVNCIGSGTASCSPTTAGVGEKITITAKGATGYTVGSIKVNEETIDGYTFFMPAKDTTVEVTFVKGGYAVNLTVGDNGTAYVSATTAGYGDKITITATPATGYVLDTIKVDGVALEPGVTEFTMGDAETNVEVTFKKASYSITVSVPEGGSAEANKTKAGYGDRITITDTAKDGYEFDKITLNDTAISGKSFDMPAGEAKVVVYFKKIPYTITVTYSEGGTASCKPTTAGVGDQVKITTNAAAGYKVASIKVNTKAIEGDTFEMPAQNTTVYVTFTKTVYPVMLTVGDNGTASVSAEKATMGDKITVTAKPATGYLIDSIKFNGSSLDVNKPEFVMGAGEAKVVVTFKKASYSITVSAPEGGTAKADATTAGYGDLITISTTDKAGYEFDKITVNGIEKDGKTFEMPADDVAVVAYFKKIEYKVSLTVEGNGIGTASVSKETANIGDTITVTVNPAAGYDLNTIKVNGTVLVGKKEFTMGNADAEVVVSFKPAEYDINVRVPEGGFASTNPTSASAGTSVKVIPSADKGYTFDKFTLNGETFTGREFTMPAGEANVVVYFKKIDYAVNLTVKDNGSASIDKNPANYGDTITVTAIPDAGYDLDAITVNGTALKAGVKTFTMGTAAVNVVVTFKKTQYPVSVSVSGEGGTASAKKSAEADEWVDVTCDPNTGYVVDKITLNDSAIAGTGFPMPAKPAKVVVTFKKAVYNITLITPVGGTATLSKSSANYAETISVTTTENTGYKLDKIYVNGIASSSKTSFTMPNEDAEVVVVFNPIDYNITVNCGANGEATVSKDPANSGDTIVITATPNPGFTIDTIKVNGTKLVGTMEFTMGNAPAEVDVTFKRADYTITSSVSGGNGKVSVVKMANEGDTVAVECTPNTGYAVDKIFVNNVAITGTSFIMSAQDTTVVVSFKLAVYKISINKPAGGTATLSQATANYGELITVTATPSTGYRLKSITVNDRVIEVESFSMPDKDAKVVVTFEKIDYEISLNQPAGGTVSVDKNPANYGDMITVTANPSEGYKLDTIKVNGKALASGVYTFKMSTSASVEATFKKIQHTITVKCSSGGTAYADPKTAGMDDTVSIICNPSKGYELASITVDGQTKEKSFLMPNKNITVNVSFKKIDYKITLASCVNGEAEVPEIAHVNDKITVDVHANPGYEFDFIKVNEKTYYSTQFTMGAEETTVEVYFKLKTLKVKITALEGGTATANPTTAKMGDTVTLTVTPYDGYKLNYIMVNNQSASTSFEMGAEDAEVTVAFVKIPYTVSLTVGSNGTANLDKTLAVIDDQIKVTVTPDENYVAVVKVNGEPIGETYDEITFPMPTTNVTVTVTFERVKQLDVGETGKAANATFTVTGAAPENGTGTVRLDKLEDNGTAAVVIPDTVSIKGYEYRVTSIGNYALANNPTMTSLKIGQYVTSIGNYVASGCRNLTKVYGGNRLKTIGTRAFNGCSRLKSFNISSAVLSKIGAYSFNGDKALKTIYVNKTTKLTKKGVKKSLKGSKIKTVKVKKSKVRKYKKIFSKKNCGRKVKVKK